MDWLEGVLTRNGEGGDAMVRREEKRRKAMRSKPTDRPLVQARKKGELS